MRLICLIILSLLISEVEAVEYGQLNQIQDPPKTIILGEGDLFEVISSRRQYNSGSSSGELNIKWSDSLQRNPTEWFQNGLVGPCEVSLHYSPNYLLHVVNYKITRASEHDNNSKYSVSINNDGSRLAVGYKENGTNAVTRVYEFDGADWQQIGTDID